MIHGCTCRLNKNNIILLKIEFFCVGTACTRVVQLCAKNICGYIYTEKKKDIHYKILQFVGLCLATKVFYRQIASYQIEGCGYMIIG